MSITQLGTSRQTVGVHMRNPDFIRLLNGFFKFQNENQAWIGKIKSRQGGEFFSETFLKNFTWVVEEENILRDFLVWIREELLSREHIFLKLYKKYDFERIIDTLLLLFYIQRNLEYGEINLSGIFERRKDICLSEMIDTLSEHGFHMREQLLQTLERGYFPISSQGEILLFIGEVQTGVAKFLGFPSGNTITAGKKGEIIGIEDEVEDDDIDGTQRDFCDWLFRDEHIENMDTQELETRIEIVKKWLHFHAGKGTILSRNEEFAYRKEYNAWYENRGDEEDYEEMTPESKRYYNSLFEKEIERQLSHLERIYNRKKRGIQVVK